MPIEERENFVARHTDLDFTIEFFVRPEAAIDEFGVQCDEDIGRGEKKDDGHNAHDSFDGTASCEEENDERNQSEGCSNNSE